jgi:hypothetical protein
MRTLGEQIRYTVGHVFCFPAVPQGEWHANGSRYLRPLSLFLLQL